MGLRKTGASPGATAAFLVATPETGVDSVAITYALLDPVMTVLRPLAAVLTAILAGLAVNETHAPDPEPPATEPTPHAHLTPLEITPSAAPAAPSAPETAPGST